MAFHIDGQGNPGLCTATIGVCPYGDADVHYSNEQDARRGFEEAMGGETLPPVRTNSQKLTRAQAIELDKFYTKDELAAGCLEKLRDRIETLGYDSDRVTFVEPSAGGGAFVRAAQSIFPDRPIAKSDLVPQDEGTITMDFLNDDYEPLLVGDREDRVVIGNPPFGYKARVAKDFINRALEFSDTVVMVLPVQFQKYGTQKDIDPEAKLVHDETMPYDAFTVNGSDYGVQCCFQIWTKRDTDQPDLRRREKPPMTHEDFNTWVVSSKPESKRHIEQAPWDYAVVTQGFAGQFEVIPRERAEELSPRRQYMLIQAHTDDARARLEQLNYEDLAARNTTRIKGFGKADLVEAYDTR